MNVIFLVLSDFDEKVVSPTACGALFSARTTPQPSQIRVEPSWNPGGTLVEPWWNPPELIWAETPKLKISGIPRSKTQAGLERLGTCLALESDTCQTQILAQLVLTHLSKLSCFQVRLSIGGLDGWFGGLKPRFRAQMGNQRLSPKPPLKPFLLRKLSTVNLRSVSAFLRFFCFAARDRAVGRAPFRGGARRSRSASGSEASVWLGSVLAVLVWPKVANGIGGWVIPGNSTYG